MENSIPTMASAGTPTTAQMAGMDLDELKDSQPRRRVLIVDDDPEIVTLLKLILRRAGLDVAGAQDAAEAVQKCLDFHPDLFLLDLMMPVVDGWEILRRLRQISPAPVVIVSAKSEKEDVIKGLDEGADDYVPKPFYPPEIISRVNAVLRRAQVDMPIASRVFEDIQLVIDFETHEVVFQGQAVPLSPKEFAVLKVLAVHAPKPVSYETIAREVWGEETAGTRNRTKWVIHRLRSKLGSDHDEEGILANRIGFGYQLNAGAAPEHSPSPSSRPPGGKP